MSASVVDQPTEMRSERWASTPMASSTGESSRPSEAQALPEWAAMPAWSRPEQDGLGLDAVDAEADQVGEPVDRVAVDAHAVERGGRGQHPVGEAPGLVVPRPASRSSAASAWHAAPRPTARARSPGRPGGPAPGRRPPAAGRRRSPRRTSSAPVPGGPPSLWPLTDSRSAPSSSKAIGTWPDRLGRVDVHQHAAGPTGGHHLGHRLEGAHLVVAPLDVHQGGATAPGWSAGRGRPSPRPGRRGPARSTPTTVTACPEGAAKASLDWRTAECSTAASTTWGGGAPGDRRRRPRRAATRWRWRWPRWRRW